MALTPFAKTVILFVLFLPTLYSTLITNDSLQKELLKMKEEIDLFQEKLEIARLITEAE